MNKKYLRAEEVSKILQVSTRPVENTIHDLTESGVVSVLS